VNLAGFFAPVCVVAVVTLLHLVVPARTVDGYVVSPLTQKPYRYRLNGLAVYWLTIGLWALACSSGLIAWDFLWTTRWEALAGACVFGLLFTLGVVLREPRTSRSSRFS
jgi:hypothetical protein